MITNPLPYYIGHSSATLYTDESWEEIERDPRGLLLMYEEPKSRARYVVGFDPTQGITGWNRATKTSGDHKTDNAAIEVFKVDGAYTLESKVVGGRIEPVIDESTGRQKRKYQDLQVAEYAAPCDAVEAARVATIVSAIYKGECDSHCELIWEAWPGPGILSTQELLRLNHTNLWNWEYITNAVETTNSLGWRSSHESQKLLWLRARRHLMNRSVIVQSKWLHEEYANAEIDLEKMRARAAYGYHDDRIQAANMALWAAHKWTYDIDREDVVVNTAPTVDFQRMAPDPDNPISWSDWKEMQMSRME